MKKNILWILVLVLLFVFSFSSQADAKKKSQKAKKSAAKAPAVVKVKGDFIDVNKDGKYEIMMLDHQFVQGHSYLIYRLYRIENFNLVYWALALAGRSGIAAIGCRQNSGAGYCSRISGQFWF